MIRNISKILTFTILFLVLTNSIHSQSPEGINYQAVLRKSNGQTWDNYQLTSKIDIIQGAFSGPLVGAPCLSTTP